jgi:hypothetical protein
MRLEECGGSDRTGGLGALADRSARVASAGRATEQACRLREAIGRRLGRVEVQLDRQRRPCEVSGETADAELWQGALLVPAGGHALVAEQRHDGLGCVEHEAPDPFHGRTI